MGALEPWHLIVILGIALVVFGPGKVGDLGGTLGRSVRDFRDSVEGKEPRAPIASTSCVNCNSAILDGSKFCPGCGLQAPTVARERQT